MRTGNLLVGADRENMLLRSVFFTSGWRKDLPTRVGGLCHCLSGKDSEILSLHMVTRHMNILVRVKLLSTSKISRMNEYISEL